MNPLSAPPRFRGEFHTDPRACAAYAEGGGIYRIIPTAVARPADVEDLARLARWAHETGTPLVPRGAGSGMGGGNVGRGVVVDLRRIGASLLLLDPVTATARTGAAVTAGTLAAAASAQHLRLPPNPSSGRWATLGGMFSTNASGPRTVRYGSVRPWVLAAEVVTAEGEVIEMRRGGSSQDVGAIGRFRDDAWPAIRGARTLIDERFPKTTKNSSGYALDHLVRSGDFIDLLIGAEGTLGFVTTITWQLDPIPPHRSGLRISLRDLDQLGELVPRLRRLGPSEIELLDRSFLEVVRDTAAARAAGVAGDEAAVLLVEFEEDSADSAAAMGERGADVARETTREVVTALTEEAQRALATLRHAASPILAATPGRRSLQVIEDGCVPIEHLGPYVAEVRRIASAQGMQAVIFGHAGDGNVHVNLLPDVSATGWAESVRRIYDEVSEALLGLGGTPTGEHGDGRLRAGLVERVYGAELVALFRKVKEDFDTRGILNPGIKLPAGDHRDPLADLKVGGGATPIPDDIAAALTAIEREGGYGRDRMEVAGGGGWTDRRIGG